MLDMGGGATSFARLASEVPLLAATEESGTLVVGLFVAGPERADLDYLEQFAAAGSMPNCHGCGHERGPDLLGAVGRVRYA